MSLTLAGYEKSKPNLSDEELAILERVMIDRRSPFTQGIIHIFSDLCKNT